MKNYKLMAFVLLVLGLLSVILCEENGVYDITGLLLSWTIAGSLLLLGRLEDGKKQAPEADV